MQNLVTINKTTVYQVLVWLAALLSQVQNSIPEEYQPYIIVVLSILSIVVTRLQAKKNPDGTPAQTSWLPKR